MGADKDFGYPLEVSSSIYRSPDMVGLINRLKFRNPNELEGQMAGWAYRYDWKRPALLCPVQSITFCCPINVVQTVAKNAAGEKYAYSSGQLADLFDKDFRIQVEAYSGFIPNGCHQEVDLQFFEKD